MTEEAGTLGGAPGSSVILPSPSPMKTSVASAMLDSTCGQIASRRSWPFCSHILPTHTTSGTSVRIPKVRRAALPIRMIVGRSDAVRNHDDVARDPDVCREFRLALAHGDEGRRPPRRDCLPFAGRGARPPGHQKAPAIRRKDRGNPAANRQATSEPSFRRMKMNNVRPNVAKIRFNDVTSNGTTAGLRRAAQLRSLAVGGNVFAGMAGLATTTSRACAGLVVYEVRDMPEDARLH